MDHEGQFWRQAGFGIRLDWGPVGAARLAVDGGALVVVDVLSFTTAVSVALDRGTAVCPTTLTGRRAGELAHELGAALAVPRDEMSSEHPWSLSPAALRAAPPPDLLVLPSPNGSSVAAASAGVVVLAACLRNARAVGGWLSRHYATKDHPVVIIPAGERWPDGSLRPALEDLLGAGALVEAIVRAGGTDPSPDAEAARAAFLGVRSLPEAVRASASGVELVERGWAQDVEIALELDRSRVIPILRDGAFRPTPDR
jgi:2-phosphosulfolactate phosphatase